MTEYKVSLRKPNKRFQIKQSDREERVYEYIKNVWTVRKFFLDNFSIDPPVNKCRCTEMRALRKRL